MSTLRRLERLDDATRVLGSLIDHLPAMVAYWDHDQRNVVANAAYVECFGCRPGEMTGRHIRDVLGEDLYGVAEPYIEAVLAGEERSIEQTLVDAGGRIRHTDARYVPDVVGGSVRGFFVLISDITARVEVERMAIRARDQYRALARNLPLSLVLLFDEDLRFSVAEGPALSLFGMTREGLEGRRLEDALPDLADFLEPRYRAALSGATVSWDRTTVDDRVVAMTAAPVSDEAGRVFAGMVLGTDVTAIRRREANDAALRRIALAAAEGRGESDLMDLIADSMVELFGAGHASIMRFNREGFEVVSVKPPLDLAGIADRESKYVSGTAAASVQATGRPQLILYGPESTGMAAAMYRAGMRVGASTPVLVNGRLWGAVGVGLSRADVDGEEVLERLREFADVAAASISSAAAWQALADLATADPLTGLANRRLFEERLAWEVESAERHRRPLSLVVVDLDHFKDVNDTGGHDVGDAVLVEVARRMESVTRVDELLARTGGDEFALLLPDTTGADAAAAAARLKEALSSSGRAPSAVTASIGVATASGGQLSGARLAKLADQALYESKRRGRNTITVADRG